MATPESPGTVRARHDRERELRLRRLGARREELRARRAANNLRAALAAAAAAAAGGRQSHQAGWLEQNLAV